MVKPPCLNLRIITSDVRLFKSFTVRFMSKNIFVWENWKKGKTLFPGKL